MDSTAIFQLLGSGVLAAIAAAIVNGIINRRKLSAEATEIIQRAASGVVERLEAERMRREQEFERERADFTRRLSDMEAREEQARAVLQLHAAWDHMAVTKLAECGVTDLPQPPPLTPPPMSRLSAR